MKYLPLLLFLLTGCNHASSSSTQTNSESVEIPKAIDSSTRIKSIEVSQARANELYGLLQKLGVKPVTVEKTTYLTLYDLACHIELPEEIARCEFYTEPPEQKHRKERQVRGKKEYEDLRMFLHSFPVEQGDPGAVAHFVQCRKYSYTDTVDCYLAVHVNYEGP